MKSSPAKKYALAKKFGKFLWGRHMAVNLRDQILKEGPAAAEVDFAGVDFATRAFADEYIKVKAFLGAKGIQISETAVCPDVRQMLDLVLARPAKSLDAPPSP